LIGFRFLFSSDLDKIYIKGKIAEKISCRRLANNFPIFKKGLLFFVLLRSFLRKTQFFYLSKLNLSNNLDQWADQILKLTNPEISHFPILVVLKVTKRDSD